MSQPILAVTPEEDVVTPPKSPLTEGLGDVNPSSVFMYSSSKIVHLPNLPIAGACFLCWAAHNRGTESRDEFRASPKTLVIRGENIAFNINDDFERA